MTRYEPLAPLYEHDELAHMDDAGLVAWADSAGIPILRDWAGRPATTLAIAYKLRADFDAEHQRKAEAEMARFAAYAAEPAHIPRPIPDGDVWAEERARWEQRNNDFLDEMFNSPAIQSAPIQPGDALAALKAKEAGW